MDVEVKLEVKLGRVRVYKEGGGYDVVGIDSHSYLFAPVSTKKNQIELSPTSDVRNFKKKKKIYILV